MKTLRTIECPIGADGIPQVRVPLYAGVAGDHHVTELQFMGDTGVFADGDELARISFSGGDGTVVSTDLLSMEIASDGWRVRYALPSALTVLGGQITARLVLSRMENGEEVQTAISGGVVLFLDDGGMENGTPFWTAVSQMLVGTVQTAGEARDCLAKVEALLGVAENGVKPLRFCGKATTAQIAVQPHLLVGDVYYNTDHSAFYLYDGEQWLRVGDKHEPLTNSERQSVARFAAKENLFLSIPAQVHVVVGEEFRMYYKNVISKPGLRLWVGNSNLTVRRYEDYLSVTAANEGTTALSWKLYDEAFRELESGTLRVVATANQAKTARALVIGDSTVTQYSAISTYLTGLFQQGKGDLTLLGTRGTAPLVHEGRAGWSAADYCTKASDSTYTNPFFNNGFDFTYYMRNQGYSGVDYVVIQLGINDVFGMTYTSFSSTSAVMYIKQMVTSIAMYNPSVKVIVNLLSVPNGNGTSFTDAYGTRQMDFVNLVNSIRTSAALMEAFKNDSRVTISPNNCVLDPTTDIYDGVHPTQTGYGKLAGILYATINGIYDGENSGGDVDTGGSEEPDDPVVTSIWDMHTRTGASRPDAGLQATAAREMKFTKYYYPEAYSGLCAATDKCTITDYAATADSLTFTLNAADGVNASTLSAVGIAVPLNLEVGKTYTFTCQAAGINMGVRLVTYAANGDQWTYESNQEICYNSTDLCRIVITPAAGKGYAINFSQKSAGVGVKNVFTHISLSENT